MTQDKRMKTHIKGGRVWAAVKVRGKGGWKRWTPEAIQKAAFSKGALRNVVQDLSDAQNKYSPTTVAHCRFVGAGAIVDGQTGGCTKLQKRSVVRPLAFWITGHVFDETKIWYKVRDMGYRHFSTLAHHTQTTFKEAGQVTQDEDIIRAPKAMERYTAATQFSILTDDPIAGIMAQEGSRPLARFYGTVTASDSHQVNKLTVKVVRARMPPDELLLPCFCLQHPVGTAAEHVAKYLNVFTRVWTLSKTFNQGDFFQSLLKKLQSILEDPDSGIEVVDPAQFELDRGDLGVEFTESIMDWCWDDGGLELGTETADAKTRSRKLREQFCRFFPYGLEPKPSLTSVPCWLLWANSLL